MDLIPTLEHLLKLHGVRTHAVHRDAFVLVRAHATGVEVLSLYSYTTTKKVRRLLTTFAELFMQRVTVDGEYGQGDGACFILVPKGLAQRGETNAH